MPLFEYTCEQCGHRFEELVMGASPEAPKCPSCGNEKVKRCLSAPSIRSGGTASAGMTPPAGSCGAGGFS